MKKIAIVIENIGKSGGTERVASVLANELSNLDFKVELISLVKAIPYYELNDGVGRINLNRLKFLHLLKVFKGKGYDVVIPISMGKLSFLVSLVRSVFRFKFKLISSEHISFSSTTYWKKKLKLLGYRLSDEVVVLTEYDKKVILKSINKKVRVIPNFSSFPKSECLDMSSKNKEVLAIGRLTYQKNFEGLIDSWALISDRQGWVLKIVGDGELKLSLEDKIQQLGLSDVHLIPSTKNIASYYKSASIYALTSRYEGLPLVLLEAKSFGLPIVSYDCLTGPAEIVKEDYDGFLVPLHDNSQFAVKLESLMCNQEKLTRMSKGALEDERFDREVVLEKWRNII